MQVLSYYLQTNLFCIILLLMVLVKLKNRSKYSTLVFKKIIRLSIVFCFIDIICILFRETSFLLSHLILIISNSLYLLFPLLIGYYWSKYVYLSFDEQVLNNVRIKIMMALPLVFGIFMMILNIFGGKLFFIDENNIYNRGEMFYIYVILSWLYIVISTIKSVKVYFKTNNIYKKEKIFPYCLFIVAPIVASFIQGIYYGVTIIQMGFTLSIVLVFLYYQDEQVSIDNLTKTNNRNKFNEYIQNKFDDTKANDIISLMFIDLDDFKKVNDKFGHLAGDEVLVLTASLLKKSCSEFNKNLFLARYGGDEFVIVSSLEFDDMKKLETLIYQNIDEENEKSNSKYKIKISIGITSDVKSNFESVNGLINRADTHMYEIKYKKKFNK